MTGPTSYDGAFIALIPTPDDLHRIRIDHPHALPPADLHLTLAFLGTADQIDQLHRDVILGGAAHLARTTQPVQAQAFAPALFNPDGDKACWTILVTGTSELDRLRRVVKQFSHPAEYLPWFSHITLIYDRSPTCLSQVEARVGPITFDRLRVAFGDEVTDFALGGN
jgi:2'-5' RNA ligase